MISKTLFIWSFFWVSSVDCDIKYKQQEFFFLERGNRNLLGLIKSIFADYKGLTLILCNFPHLRTKWNVKADGDGDSDADRRDDDRHGDDAGDDHTSYFLLLC